MHCRLGTTMLCVSVLCASGDHGWDAEWTLIWYRVLVYSTAQRLLQLVGSDYYSTLWCVHDIVNHWMLLYYMMYSRTQCIVHIHVCMLDANLKWAKQRNIHFPSGWLGPIHCGEKTLFPHIPHSLFLAQGRAEPLRRSMSCFRVLTEFISNPSTWLKPNDRHHICNSSLYREVCLTCNQPLQPTRWSGCHQQW